MRKLSGIHLALLVIVGLAAGQDQPPDIIVNPGTNATNQQRIVTKLLKDTRYSKTIWKGSENDLKAPSFRGQPLTKLLRNKTSSDTNELTLDEMFTLKQVITGEEPEIVTYQVPISYDVLASMTGTAVTNAFDFGYLKLLMDSDPDDDLLNDPELTGLERATNGDCLLVWNTAFERPGQHAMQVLFMAEPALHQELLVRGPVNPFFSSNLCRFFPGSSLFDDSGAFIDAQAIESNAVFSIEIKSKSGAHVKTLIGRTTNGVIHVD
jgi:hypothetical protein